jgi:hypothetical protein
MTAVSLVKIRILKESTPTRCNVFQSHFIIQQGFIQCNPFLDGQRSSKQRRSGRRGRRNGASVMVAPILRLMDRLLDPSPPIYFLPPMTRVRAFSALLSSIDDGGVGGGAFVFVCEDIVQEVST